MRLAGRIETSDKSEHEIGGFDMAEKRRLLNHRISEDT